MGWELGIPPELGPYTYFKSLNTTDISEVGKAKQKLYTLAKEQLGRGLSELTNVQKITAADNFLASVAISEREKEIEAVKTYSKETGKKFSALKEFFEDPNKIYNEPERFYLNLAHAINVARTNIDDYQRELKRIKHNLDEVNENGKSKRNLYNYINDDYRYKLVNDITSFMAHLTGNEQWIKQKLHQSYNESEFTLKVQNIAMKAIQESNLINLITSGEDFAAIAASVLMEVEQNIQKEVDKISPGKTLNNVSDEILNMVEKKYLTQLKSKDGEKTAVQRALNDITSTDYSRITRNAKQLLGLKIDQNKFKHLSDDLTDVKKYVNDSPNDFIKAIRARVSGNSSLSQNLQLLDFNISGSSKSKQGAINELILGISGSKVRDNVATDIITYRFNWTEQINDKGLDQLTNQIGDAFSSVLYGSENVGFENKRDIRKSINEAYSKIEDLIKAAEDELKNLEDFDKTNNLFIFHETVKLYSSVETKSTQDSVFHGRNMNILSYIDYLSSAATVGLSGNDLIDRNILAFFARNLVNGAIADTDEYIGPLERYFAIYAGMIMFDDVVAIAKEAVNNINNSNNVIGGKIKQIHLYNVNGIYVPASMILSKFSSALNEGNKLIMEDLISTHITTRDISTYDPKKPTDTFIEKKKFYNSFKYNLDISVPLSEDDWDNVSSIAIENTKVSMIFLMSFDQFIRSLLTIE